MRKKPIEIQQPSEFFQMIEEIKKMLEENNIDIVSALTFITMINNKQEAEAALKILKTFCNSKY